MALALPQPVLILRVASLFAPWYLWEMPRRIVRNYIAYARAFAEMFSFSFMLWTLLEPWKGITDTYDMRGLNLERIAETFFLNLTTRMIGFLFRIVAICIGLIVQILALAVCLLCLTAWLAYPAALIFAVLYLLTVQ